MKIIDLLNKIANNGVSDEIQHIKYFDRNAEKNDICMLCYKNLIYKLDCGQLDINDEVEIIEEEKKIPEKLSTWFSVEQRQTDEENNEFANYNFEKMYEKINEICDYLKSKGEE